MEASALHAPVRLSRLSLGAPLLRLRSDEQLVALFRGGSEEAFSVIHDRYRQRLHAYTRQMLSGCAQDAEDAMQDVFIRAYSSLRNGDRPIALRPWLYRVAHNRCIDQLRRPVFAPTELVESAAKDAPRAPDPLAEAERREDLRRLIADVRRLPEQQRSVLLMRELEGLSYEDLSATHDTSVAAIKSLLVRARIGLVQAAEARDASCAEIRCDLALAYGRGVRANGRARRHLKDCDTCREYRVALRGMERKFAAIAPAGGGLLGLLGIGGGGGGALSASTGGAAVGGATGVGAAAGGSSLLGGGAAVITATKVAVVVAAAAITGAGAVSVERTVTGPASQEIAPASAPVLRTSKAALALAATPAALPGVGTPLDLTAPLPDVPTTGVPTNPGPVVPDTSATTDEPSGGLVAPEDNTLDAGTGITAPDDESQAPHAVKAVEGSASTENNPSGVPTNPPTQGAVAPTRNGSSIPGSSGSAPNTVGTSSLASTSSSAP